MISVNHPGWRLPTEQEVITLVYNFAGMDVSAATGTFTQSGTSVPDAFKGLFGYIEETDVSYRTRAGFLRENGLWGSIYSITSKGSISDNRFSVLFYGDTITGSHTMVGPDTIWLVSDGGTTQSSIINPSLNINNPQAPVNVSAPLGLGVLGAVMMLFAGFSRKRKA